MGIEERTKSLLSLTALASVDPAAPDTTIDKGVDRLDDPKRPATSAQPEALTESEKNQLSRLGTVVSRGGIEPPTRRLRVCCSAN